MALVRLNVHCFRCRNIVNSNKARVFDIVERKRRYECFECFKKNKIYTRADNDSYVKQERYCERCKYKFNSKSDNCPYCNKNDSVASKFEVKELF